MSVKHCAGFDCWVWGLWQENWAEKGWSLLCRWSNGCCFISVQAGTDSSGKRWFIDHSHCHGVSKLAQGRYEQTGTKMKKRRKEEKKDEKMKNLQSNLDKDLKLFFGKNSCISPFLFLSSLIYSVSGYHLVSLIQTYCTRSGLMKLSQR